MSTLKGRKWRGPELEGPFLRWQKYKRVDMVDRCLLVGRLRLWMVPFYIFFLMKLLYFLLFLILRSRQVLQSPDTWFQEFETGSRHQIQEHMKSIKAPHGTTNSEFFGFCQSCYWDSKQSEKEFSIGLLEFGIGETMWWKA